MVAERPEQKLLIAPLFADGGMAFWVGSGGSDYLDFVGENDAELLEGILSAAAEAIPDFVGFRFYHLPDSSGTGPSLQQAAGRLGMKCFIEQEFPAPEMEFSAPGVAAEAVGKKSLVRHENFFRRSGNLEIHHLADAARVLPQLEAFFDQHAARWESTPYPSLFLDPIQRDFYRKLTVSLSEAGWLRFTRVDWEGQPVAFHFGFSYQGSFFWYKPSFDKRHAKHSPGEVLLRQLILSAAAEGARVFDFGLGDEAFKSRFATRIKQVKTWGIYPEKKS